MQQARSRTADSTPALSALFSLSANSVCTESLAENARECASNEEQHYLTGLRERRFNYPSGLLHGLFDHHHGLAVAPGQEQGYAEYERGLHAEWEHARLRIGPERRGGTPSVGSLREYMGHECLKAYTTMLAYASAPASSGLLARGGGPGIVLVRTGHVGTGIEGLRLLLGPASPPTAIGWSPPHAYGASTTPTHPVQCTA